MELYCKSCSKDIEPIIKKRGIHTSAFCPICDSYIKHVTQQSDDFIMYFGKYKGQSIKELASTKDGYNYLLWVLNNISLKPKYKAILEDVLR